MCHFSTEQQKTKLLRNVLAETQGRAKASHNIVWPIEQTWWLGASTTSEPSREESAQRASIR